MPSAWLSSLHHDGSDRFVSNLHPALGERVTLRLRVDVDAPVRRAFLRSFPDGEQRFSPMRRAATDTVSAWWEAELPIFEPSVTYRFIVEADDGVWWLNGEGATAAMPTDAADFRLLADTPFPAWVIGSVFYQIFPDRFANGQPANDGLLDAVEYRGVKPVRPAWGEPPPAGAPPYALFYGGDLAGVAQGLDHIASLGANAIYLNPVFHAYSNHRYDVASYEQVDPRLGGDDALIALRTELTRRGMRYLLDIVPNHCGTRHPWFLAAQADPNSAEAGFFTFRQHPNEYESWLGVRSLPKLNYSSLELRRRMFEAPDAIFRRWLRPPFGADGWRVDVANMLARQGVEQRNGQEIANGIRAAVKEARPDAYLLGEHFFDASPHLQGDRWDATMNYLGFAKPVWNWLRGFRQGAFGSRDEISSPLPWPTEALEQTLRHTRAAIPWAIALQQFNLLGSHDTGRILSLLGGKAGLLQLAVTLLMTYVGVPSVYYGDEVGLSDDPDLGSRGCMPWDPTRWNADILELYRGLIGLRRESAALQRGGYQTLLVEPDAIAYARATADEQVIVLAHRGAQARVAGAIPVRHAGIPDGATFVEHFSGARATVTAGALPVPELAQGAQVWRST
ncbi:MAG TPA: alpha-amylase family glycosyl hydrolase [Thermoflexales bacterium]|nr:alpha-amylase family glycosyl hydrolase [Thermoflexales bacterium]